MNSQERVAATFAGRPTDRRAVVQVMSLYGSRFANCSLKQYYTDPAAYARGQVGMWETFQPDVLFCPFHFCGIGEAFGSEQHYFADQAPNIRRPAIQSADEWGKLVLPNPDTHPSLVFFREATRLMVEGTRGQVPIAAALPPPFDLPMLIMGMEPWLETVLFDTETARRIVDEITPFFVKLTNGLVEAGAAFVVLPCTLASPAVVSREIATNFARPILQEVLPQLNGPNVLHHGGAPLLPYLDVLTGLPSTVAFALDHNDNLAQARRIAGPDQVLLGGVCGPEMPRMTPAQVESQCSTVLEDRHGDPRFVLYTSGPDVPLTTKPETIHAMRQAAIDFSRRAVAG